MSSMNLMYATTGTRALGIVPIGSWLTSEPGCHLSPLQASPVQVTGVPATAAVSARPFAGVAVNGTDAARKRGRPPRGEPR